MDPWGYNYNYRYGVDDIRGWNWESLPTGVQTVLLAVLGVIVLVCIALVVLHIVGMWKTFEKAKLPGWGAIIPGYNVYLMVKLTGLELWWLPVLLIAWGASWQSWVGMVALGMWLAMNYKVSKSFGKGMGMAIGLALVGPICWMILGFSKDKYIGPAGPYIVKSPKAEAKKIAPID